MHATRNIEPVPIPNDPHAPVLYDETNVPPPEYRVRTVARYTVTRYCHPYESRDGRCASSGQSSVIGEFLSEQQAWEVASALARAEPGRPGTVQG